MSEQAFTELQTENTNELSTENYELADEDNFEDVIEDQEAIVDHINDGKYL